VSSLGPPGATAAWPPNTETRSLCVLSNRGALAAPLIAILGAAPCRSWGTVPLPIEKVGGAADQIASWYVALLWGPPESDAPSIERRTRCTFLLPPSARAASTARTCVYSARCGTRRSRARRREGCDGPRGKSDAGAVRAKSRAPDEEEEEEPAYAAAHLVASSTVHMGDMCARIGVQCARQALRGGFAARAVPELAPCRTHGNQGCATCTCAGVPDPVPGEAMLPGSSAARAARDLGVRRTHCALAAATAPIGRPSRSLVSRQCGRQLQRDPTWRSERARKRIRVGRIAGWSWRVLSVRAVQAAFLSDLLQFLHAVVVQPC